MKKIKTKTSSLATFHSREVLSLVVLTHFFLGYPPGIVVAVRRDLPGIYWWVDRSGRTVKTIISVNRLFDARGYEVDCRNADKMIELIRQSGRW